MRKQFNVAGLPTVILARSGGEEIDRTLGFVATGDFIATMEGYHKGVGTLASMTAVAEDKAGDLDFAYAYGEKLYAHGRFEDADVQFAAVVRQDPGNESGKAAEAQMNRARVYSKLKDYQAAVAFCEALIKRWPQSPLLPDATIYAAYYADKGSMTDDAVAGYKAYVKRWPEGEDADYARKEIKRLTSVPEDE